MAKQVKVKVKSTKGWYDAKKFIPTKGGEYNVQVSDHLGPLVSTGEFNFVNKKWYYPNTRRLFPEIEFWKKLPKPLIKINE